MLPAPSVVVNKPSTELAFSSIPSQYYLLTNVASRNVTATYKWFNTVGQNKTDKKAKEVVLSTAEAASSEIIVIHPTSTALKIGTCAMALPISIPNVIARRTCDDMDDMDDGDVRKGDDSLDNHDEDDRDEGDGFKGDLSMLHGMLKSRLQELKKRSIPNAKSLVESFNSTQTPKSIEDHNDAYRLEWSETRDSKPAFLIGKEALYIEPGEPYVLRHPFDKRRFNRKEYSSDDGSVDEILMADIEAILMFAIEQELGIKKRDFPNHSIVLVIPDLFDRRDLSLMLRILLNFMRFKQIALIQESVGATFGAGMPSAMVIDIGATSTSVSCVEEGFCVPNSRILLPYGGNEVTYFFLELLKASAFPYKPCDARTNRLDFALINEMKERFCTLVENDLNVNLCDFYVRRPGDRTRSYQIKTFDEVILAPMSLFCLPDIYEKLGYGTVRDQEKRDDYYDPEDYLGIFQPEEKSVRQQKIQQQARAEEIIEQEKDIVDSEMADAKISGGAGGDDDEDDTNAVVAAGNGENMDIEMDVEMDVEPVHPLQIAQLTCQWTAGNGSCCRLVHEGFSALINHVREAHIGEVGGGKGVGEGEEEDVFQGKWAGESVTSISKQGLLSKISNIIVASQNDDHDDDHDKEAAERKEMVTNSINEQLMTLEVAIIQSVECLLASGMDKGTVTERMKRQFSNILLVGGSSSFPGLAAFLEHRLKSRLSEEGYPVIPAMDWIVNVKDLSPSLISWIGACVYGKLGGSGSGEDDIWITGDEWNSHGVKVIQAKGVFQLL